MKDMDDTHEATADMTETMSAAAAPATEPEMSDEDKQYWEDMALFMKAGHYSKIFLIVMLGVIPNLLMITAIL